MYSEYRTLKTHQCLVMNEGVSSKEAASCFVNPLTALGMVETMREEGFGLDAYRCGFKFGPDAAK